jgi:hypothetical protein
MVAHPYLKSMVETNVSAVEIPKANYRPVTELHFPLRAKCVSTVLLPDLEDSSQNLHSKDFARQNLESMGFTS